MKHANKIKIMILLVIASMLFGFVPAGYAQDNQDWSDPINLSMSGLATNPSMVVDSNGTLHVIWVDQFDGFKYVQSTDGLTWSAPITVRFPFSTEGSPPVMFGDPKGMIHMFWISDQNKLVYAQTLNENLDTPPGWRRRIDLDNTVYDFDASLDVHGGVHVSYIKNPAPVAGTAGVFYRNAVDGGLNWSRAKLLYESPYFRTVTAENAHVRMAVSDDPEQKQVFAVWDDRVQKRIFIVTSVDGGSNWGPVKEMIAPQANLGYRSPFDADIDVLGDKTLVTWLVGEEGGRCTPFSWSSADGGETWGEQTPILSESGQCPERREFIAIEPEYSVSLFNVQGDLSLSAWNGSDWSDPEVQTGPSSITNPATFDQVLLGCEQAVSSNGRLFVVGCDEGPGRDVWFISRQFDPLENLFPLPSAWSGDATLTTIPRKMESLVTVTDNAGNAHAVWIQYPYQATDPFLVRVEYSRWNGTEWLRPAPILTNVGGRPTQLALQIDGQQRLLLSWVNQEAGELMFSWSSAEKANLSLEWLRPVVLSASSKLTSSPDILVDSKGTIVITYAVTLNEGRGIYMIQSNDLGSTWSSPGLIFDAVSADWEMVDQPKLALSDDGTLHLIFTRYSLLGDPQPMGLYYSRSEDGGLNWSPAEIVNEQPIQWSEILSQQGTLHRLWQEKNRLVATTAHQTSLDGGKTWSSPDRLPGNAELDARPSVSVDWMGNVHFLQVTKQDNQVLQEWEWSGGRWQLLESSKVTTQVLNSPVFVASSISSNGVLYALLQLEELHEDGIQTKLRSLKRSLENTGVEQPPLASISTPSISLVPTSYPDPNSTSTPEIPVVDLNDPQPRVNRGLVGFILIATVVLFLLVLTVPRRNKEPKESK